MPKKQNIEKEELEKSFGNILSGWSIGAKAKKEFLDNKNRPPSPPEEKKTSIPSAKPISKKEKQQKEPKGFIQFPRKVEYFLRELSLSEQAVYRIFYKNSHSWGRETCSIGYTQIAKECNCNWRTIKRAVDRLIKRDWVVVIEHSYTAPTKYKIYLPQDVMSGHALLSGDDNKSGPDTLLTHTKSPHTSSGDNVSGGDYLSGGHLTNSQQGADNMSGGDSPKKPFKSLVSKDILQSKKPPLEHYLEHNRTLSLINNFYMDINQSNISKKKRERAEMILKELLQQYSVEQVQFALHWTAKNIQGVRDISLVRDTISQALPHLEKHKQAQIAEKINIQKKKKEIEQLKAQELKDRAVAEQLSNLNPEEMKELEEKARILLKTESNNPFFDKLLTAKIRELVGQQLGQIKAKELCK